VTRPVSQQFALAHATASFGGVPVRISDGGAAANGSLLTRTSSNHPESNGLY
jgi:hypothetical protein